MSEPVGVLWLVLQEVTKVFLGAAAVMSNGTVMSRVGAAGVAMMASTWEKPVIICCETYKFHERVLLDSITSNELGDPEVFPRELLHLALVYIVQCCIFFLRRWFFVGRMVVDFLFLPWAFRAQCVGLTGVIRYTEECCPGVHEQVLPLPVSTVW